MTINSPEVEVRADTLADFLSSSSHSKEVGPLRNSEESASSKAFRGEKVRLTYLAKSFMHCIEIMAESLRDEQNGFQILKFLVVKKMRLSFGLILWGAFCRFLLNSRHPKNLLNLRQTQVYVKFGLRKDRK